MPTKKVYKTRHPELKDANHYASIHSWLRYNFGKADHCENIACERISKSFDWALVKRKKYDYRRENFIQLCKKCHSKYDWRESMRANRRKSNYFSKRTHCPKGHEYAGNNLILFKKNGRRRRRCRACKISLLKRWREKPDAKIRRKNYQKQWKAENKDKVRKHYLKELATRKAKRAFLTSNQDKKL